MEVKKNKVDESLIFMGLLTFIGGFINAYAFFTRGQAFVSMHTGNMAKIGLSLYQNDFNMLISSIVPISGCLLGAIFAQLLKFTLKEYEIPKLQKALLLTELIILLGVGFISTSFSNNIVNFLLSVITTFQLSNFRKYNGNVHNSTIATGNLRSLGAHIGDVLIKKDVESFKIASKYFILVFSFPVGIFFGGLLSTLCGIYAIWFCCIILLFLASLIKYENK
ncbi:YoaK family protein [uncultured Fusobacterium sp.]|uniref:YoaK family protein n=1 Tax=uncultured Fusobacterium sp. TaxID=159267 RepID=UPI000BBAB7D0|nr:YoaK family protein [uncultured Fusobacterium sp.]BBA51201.1 hypothetical protein FV113G1_15500 [Fusobacterium varium]